MYQILRPISLHLSMLYKKSPTRVFCKFSANLFVQLLLRCAPIALARVQYPDASLSLSLYLFKSWPSFATITCIQQQLLTHIHTHTYADTGTSNSSPCRARYASVFGELISLCCQFSHSLISSRFLISRFSISFLFHNIFRLISCCLLMHFKN